MINKNRDTNRPLKFAIISGAGPMAGALLYELVIEKLQAKGAWRDQDFPNILLHNIPFANMLNGHADCDIVRNQLLAALCFLKRYCDFIYISCQTLHAFLSPEEIKQNKVVSLLDLIKARIQNEDKNIFVIASNTSRLINLHSKALNKACKYIEPNRAEQAIGKVLRGEPSDLYWVENIAHQQIVILGCTEFSVALRSTKAPYIIDPIKLAANDIVQKFLSYG